MVNSGLILLEDKENYNHIAKSLRARIGESLLLIDEQRIQYETVIEDITTTSIRCRIEKSYFSNRDLEFNLYLAQSPLRSDAQSFVIEKATELGVRGVIPIMTDNCALNQVQIAKKIERWQRLMYESSKQCERAVIPKCEGLSSIDNLCKSGRFDKIFAFCEREAEKTFREYFLNSPIIKGENILVIIGPEGGFSNSEFTYFEELSIPKLTLGNMILRAETAVTVALGNIVYEYENFGKNKIR